MYAKKSSVLTYANNVRCVGTHRRFYVKNNFVTTF